MFDPSRQLNVRDVGRNHSPYRVHVFRDRKLVVKWNIENWQPMKGEATRQILRYIEELRKEGSL